jgi:hypothetical protein
MTAEFDQKLRLYTYQHVVNTGSAPKVVEAARDLGVPEEEARKGYERLSQGHAIMLEPESGELWRVSPFSAVPTPFPVSVGEQVYYGNCIWDALGIPATLGRDAVISAACGCCNQAMELHVRGGALVENDGVIHIAVPASRWYEDVVFT